MQIMILIWNWYELTFDNGINWLGWAVWTSSTPLSQQLPMKTTPYSESPTTMIPNFPLVICYSVLTVNVCSFVSDCVSFSSTKRKGRKYKAGLKVHESIYCKTYNQFMVCAACSLWVKRAILHTFIYSSHGSQGDWDIKKSPEVYSVLLTYCISQWLTDLLLWDKQLHFSP